MHTLVFGAKGQLGRDLVGVFGRDGDVTGFDLPELDIADAAQVNRIVADARCDLIVNAAAYTDVEGAEDDSENAYRVNEAGARIVASATSGLSPKDVFLTPVPAVREVVRKAGWSIEDVDLFEISEAFAAQVLACQKQLEIPLDKINIHGGAIALGHPLGASGARILVTLLHALNTENKRTGIAVLCLGGGNAVAMAVERIR